MNNDLIKRYIYAVTCHLAVKTQPEVEREMESMITELVDARCAEVEPTDDDIKAVLTELGSPEKLAVKYSGDENKALISGIYLLWFRRVLKIVLPISAALTAFVTLISVFVEWQPPQEMYEFMPHLMAEVLSSAISSAIQSILWVGIVFIILEHKKVKFGNGDFLSKLRPVPDKRARIKIHEPIINILWHVAAVVLLLGFPYLIGGYSEGTGWISAFDTAYIRGAWYFIIIWAAFGIIREGVKLFELRYSKRLALTTVIAHVFTGISATLFFINNRIMNPDFVEKVTSMVEGAGEAKISRALEHINLFILAIMLFALLLDIGVTVYRALKYDK